MYHELPALLVEDRLGSPHAAHLAPFHVLLVGQGREVDARMRPVYEVPRLHEHQSPVVAPTVFLAFALPFRAALAVALPEDVEVRHGYVEGTVRTAEDVRIADAPLHGYGVTPHDGLVPVECCPGVAVTAQCRMQTVVLVLVIDHEVGRELVSSSRRSSMSLLFLCGHCRCQGKKQSPCQEFLH